MSEMKFNLSAEGFKELFKRGLTKRQVEVVEMIGQSSTHKSIGEKLFISEKTVKFHLTEIYKKLGLKNKAELFLLIHVWFEKKEPETQENKDLPFGQK